MNGLPKLEDMMVQIGTTLKDALSVINHNTLGACFVVDGQSMIGVLSDGDIRRALINDIDLHADVSLFANKNFISLPVHTSLTEIQSQLSGKIKIIPIVDKEGR